MALSKNTKFWINRIALMAAVIAVALVFLFYVPESVTPVGTASSSANKKTISDSVSRFYSEFRQSSDDPFTDRYGEYTIYLEDQNDKPLDQSIEQISAREYQPTENWEGEEKQRAFAAQSTLMQEATVHANKEGFNLVWDLNQDFVIRHRYQSNTTLVGMLIEMAGAIDSNFHTPIGVYFCPRKRALIITVRESKYLDSECTAYPLNR